MSKSPATTDLFFEQAGLDRSRVQTIVDDTLTGANCFWNIASPKDLFLMMAG